MFASCIGLLLVDSSRTGMSEPRIFSVRLREGRWNKCCLGRKNDLVNALCIVREAVTTDTKFIPQKIEEVQYSRRSSVSYISTFRICIVEMYSIVD